MQNEDKKLALAGWLQKNDEQSYSSSVKLQKFIFLYEAFSSADGEEVDFGDLYGYAHGPVYKTLYETYKNDKTGFNKDAARAYETAPDMVDCVRAKAAGFVIQILTQDELSALSHRFDIWAAKEDRIRRGEHNVKLDADDFGTHDVNLAGELRSLYPLNMIENSVVLQRRDVSFVFAKEDLPRLSEAHYAALGEIAKQGPGPAGNPLFVEIDSDGCMVID